jgi:hypothetical protein
MDWGRRGLRPRGPLGALENTESEAPDIVRFAQRDSAALNEICVSAGRNDDVLDDGDIVLVRQGFAKVGVTVSD